MKDMTISEYPSYKDKVKTQEKQAKEGSARVGYQCLSDLGQWSHYLLSVGGDPLGKYPDLQTQKGILSKKSDHGKNQQPYG